MEEETQITPEDQHPFISYRNLDTTPKTALMLYRKINKLTDRIEEVEKFASVVMEQIELLKEEKQNKEVLSKLEEIKHLLQSGRKNI